MLNGKEYRYAHDLLKEKYPEYASPEGSWKKGDVPMNQGYASIFQQMGIWAMEKIATTKSCSFNHSE